MPELACMIHVGGQEYCIDPAGGVIGVLGKSWTLSLIGVLGNRGATRFNELQDSVHGIGSKILAQRLKELGELKLVSRTVFAEVPARVEYRLTETGVQLRQALIPLLSWATAHPSASGVAHRASGPAQRVVPPSGG
jgi:DNA-binding HxlR family transcriptional regulator